MVTSYSSKCIETLFEIISNHFLLYCRRLAFDVRYVVDTSHFDTTTEKINKVAEILIFTLCRLMCPMINLLKSSHSVSKCW